MPTIEGKRIQVDLKQVILAPDVVKSGNLPTKEFNPKPLARTDKPVTLVDLQQARKSRHSQLSCVVAGRVAGKIGIADSKNADAPAITVSAKVFKKFLRNLKAQ